MEISNGERDDEEWDEKVDVGEVMLVSVWVPVLLLACEGVVSFFLAKASR